MNKNSKMDQNTKMNQNKSKKSENGVQSSATTKIINNKTIK